MTTRRWGLVWLSLSLLVGCASTGGAPTPVSLGCANSGQDVTDAASCWLWNDTVEREKPPDNAGGQRALLRGMDGSSVVTAGQPPEPVGRQ